MKDALRLVRWFVGLVIGSLLALVFGFLVFNNAFAHDHNRPDLDGWYPTLRSTGGGPCCDGKDQTHLAGEDWESRDGRHRVRIDGEWLDVPKDAVLTEPNRDGRTLVWIYKTNGRTVVRCFMAGAMG